MSWLQIRKWPFLTDKEHIRDDYLGNKMNIIQ